MAITGLRELQRKLKAIPGAAKTAAKTAVVQGATEIAGLQQRLAPVDKGDLRKSIAVTPPGGTTPPYSQPGGARVASEFQAIITAGNSDVRYAHLVEYGAAPHIAGGIFDGAQHPGTPAQPFFWPAYRALRKRSKRRISTNIKKAIVGKAKKT
jgi:HK97 gp10 family phage protein